MSIMKILAPVTGGKRDAVVLATAFAAARPFNAHVKVLFSHPDPREVVPYSEMPLSPDVIQGLVDTAEEVAATSSKAARGTLATEAAKADVRIVSTQVKATGVTASYEERTGNLVSSIEEAALLSDLIVFPPLAKSDNPEMHDAFIRVLTRSEQPILLSAQTAPAEFGRRIAVGWDGAIAAAHALKAAMPFLRKASALEILSVRQTTPEPNGARDVKGYLALHGVNSMDRVIKQATSNIAEVLLDSAVQDGCDLLVVGGYGHSRLRETIFGGVTQYVVSHPKIPVFMVH